MAPDRHIGRYRRWYGRLLHLYPRPFRERFAGPMAQTFTDLCRERADADRGLIGFVARTLAETSAGILRENLAHMSTQISHYLRWVLFTALVLLVPYLAMLFRVGIPDPGSGTDGLNWGPMDFAIVGILVFGAGLLYEYASTRSASALHKLAVAIAVGASLLLVWISLAVGMIGRDGNPANLVYIVVLAIALIGSSVARFEPRHASVAMVAAAIVQTLIAGFAVALSLPATPVADLFFIGLWIASSLLFRQASFSSVASH